MQNLPAASPEPHLAEFPPGNIPAESGIDQDEVMHESGHQELGLWDAVSLIVGIVIGAGVYETAPLVLANVSGPLAAIGVWTLGGVLSLVGACCYAELASTYPRSGGDYVYLSRAFGNAVGFLFAWAQLVMIMTGSIAMMAYVFADYAVSGFGFDPAWSAGLAALAVLALSLLNILSVNAGKRAQNLLSWLKVGGLLAVVFAGFWVSARGGRVPMAAQAPAGAGSFGLAMVLVLYTYGGWNDAAFVAAEVRDRRKNLPRALLLGTLAVTLVYILVNAAFMAALGFERARQSNAIATDVLDVALGRAGAFLISVLVMLSALGATNALIFTGSRVQSSVGSDYSVLRLLGKRPSSKTPVGALLTQLGVTLLLIGIVGTSLGRRAVDAGLSMVGIAPAVWVGHGGFDTLLRCSAPIFWVFFLLTGLSLFVLRRQEPERPRPFRVPFYPVLPLVFCLTCAYMLYSATTYAGGLSLVGIVPVLLGLPLYFVSRKRAATPKRRGRPALDSLA